MTDQGADNYLIIEDCKYTVLRNGLWKASDDYALFHFTSSRAPRNKSLFDDCTFLNLFIAHRTAWGAPIPSTFQIFFEDILKAIIPEGYKLILNIVDLYEGYFEPHRFIETFLKPSNYLYFFLDKEIGGKTYPTLFFEYPIDRLKILEDVAFPGTVTDVDGFVLEDPSVEMFQRWHNQGNTDAMFRDLIKTVYFAFGMWSDLNGLFIVTDKFDIPELRKKLRSSDLEKRIAHYIRNYSRSSE